MSNLVTHAESEMRRAGLYDKDADYGGMIPEAVMELVKAHAKQGHSGGSHWVTLEVFNKVINFKTLSPITSDPSEWMLVSDAHKVWQSTREPATFSEDGGKTWYNLDDPEKKNWPKHKLEEQDT